MAVVAILNKGTSRCDKAMQSMRSLLLFTAKHNLILSAQHIPGADNGVADALSRNDKNSFLIQVAGARRDPTPIPPDLLEALLLIYKIGPRRSGQGCCWPHGERHRRVHLPGIPQRPKLIHEILWGSVADAGPCIRGSAVFIRDPSPGTTS